jgi:hypothetical protein
MLDSSYVVVDGGGTGRMYIVYNGNPALIIWKIA